MNNVIAQKSADYYNSKGHFTTGPLSISVVELDEMESPKQLADYLETLIEVTRITFMEGVAEKYPHLVSSKNNVKSVKVSRRHPPSGF